MVPEPNSAETSPICEAWIHHRKQSIRRTKTHGGNQILMRGEIPHFPKFSFSYNFPQWSWARRHDKNEINTSALPQTLNREMQKPDVHGFQKHREERRQFQTVRGCIFLAGLRPQQPLADRRPARLSQSSWLESPGTETVAHDCNGNLCAETRNWGLRKDSRGRAN